MDLRIGYLLPTREGVMEDRHEAAPITDLAARAEACGLDSVWIGDSVLAKPRHDPLIMLAAIAGRTKTIGMGTAVLLPLLRNPVLLAQQLATLDQAAEGRFIVGIGIGNDLPAVRAEFEAVGVPFEKRVGRLIEAFQLCKALWSGEPVDWDGRWTLRDSVLGPKPHTSGGPPIWAAGDPPIALKRCARYFDGWFPSGPSDAAVWATRWAEVQGYAQEAGRDPGSLTGAAYLTLSINDDGAAADDRLNYYLEQYYLQPAEVIRRRQGCYTGPQAGAIDWLRGFVVGGATHLALRLIGNHERNIEIAAQIRSELHAD
jgi:alkanesulfonate monooxygenase SsuD/methylene tetrahydromethanopterin reductase-like flavin-dependent oxidoreductase (luciferase family)|tara:strand:- start:92 stop:1036 length:945 start_codon:yes stop_codon:yes gene_type:complete